MKKIILFLTTFLPFLVLSQKNFEGKITYKGTSTNASDSFEIQMFYSDSKVKIKVNAAAQHKETNKMEIYDFKKGIHYSILENEKRYLMDSLDNLSVDDHNNNMKDTSLTEYILGYYCKSLVEVQGKGNFSERISTIYWYSDSIKSIIPEKYWNKRQYGTADGNMIFLKMQAKMDLSIPDENNKNKSEIEIFMIVANKIEKMKIDDSEFLPPADYTSSVDFNHNKRISRDSVRIREITITDLSQEEKKPEPPPPPPPKKSQSPKSPAKKEKQKPVKE